MISNSGRGDPWPSKRPTLFGRSVHLGGYRQRDHQCRDAADRECEKLLIHWGLRTPRGAVPKFESGEGFALRIPRTAGALALAAQWPRGPPGNRITTPSAASMTALASAVQSKPRLAITSVRPCQSNSATRASMTFIRRADSAALSVMIITSRRQSPTEVGPGRSGEKFYPGAILFGMDILFSEFQNCLHGADGQSH